MLQGKLADELTAKSGRPVSRGLIARWESNLERSRATPHPDHLIALANMTESPWQTLFWFMDDEVPATRGVEYRPDGTRILEPNWSDEEVEGFFSALSTSKNEKPDEKFAEMVDTPSGLEKLRKHFARMASEEKLASAREDFGDLDDSGEEPRKVRPNLPEGRVVIPKSDKGATSVRVARFSERGTSIGEGALPGPINFTITDTNAPTTGISNEAGRERLAYFSERRRKQELFWGAVQWQLEEEFGVPDVADKFFIGISSGIINVKVGFFDNKYLVQFVRLFRDFSLDENFKELPTAESIDRPFVRMELTNNLAQMVLAEKIKGKTYKKLILGYGMKNRAMSEPLLRQFQSWEPSLKLIGVSLDIATGSYAVAKALNDFFREDGIQD
jgi:hypothetical protein